MEESGDDDNFTISALKFLNLFDIKTKAKNRTTSSKDMNREELLRLGWQRNALQALYFGPNDLLSPEQSWSEITNRLIVAPVVGTLVYENVPKPVNEWAKRVPGGTLTESCRATLTHRFERVRENSSRRFHSCRRLDRKRQAGEEVVRTTPTKT